MLHISLNPAASLEKIFEIQKDTLKYSKLIEFLGNKKSNLNQNARCDHSNMQQGVLLHFWVIFDTEMRPKYGKNYSVIQL